MSAKDDLLSKLDQGFDADLLNVLNVTLGTVDPLPMPTTTSEAIVTNAKVAVNFNNAWMVPLSGVPLVKLLLHTGQRNKTLQEILIAGLQLKDPSQQTCTGSQAKDYVGIDGLSELPGLGIFTGLTGNVTVNPPDIEIPNTEHEPIDAALWTAQTGIIDAQSDYLMKIKDVLNEKFRGLPKMTSTRAIFIKSILSWIAGKVAQYLHPSPFIDEIVESIFGFLWDLMSFLVSILTNYVTLCDAMKAENTALNSIENTRANYQLRREILTQHYQTVDAIIAHINACESSITAIEEKIPKGWEAWIDEMDAAGAGVTDWLDQAVYAADVNWDYTDGATTRGASRDGGESGGGGASGSWDVDADRNTINDVPVPVPPKIPLPPKIPDQGFALIHLLRFALRVVLEMEKRRMDREVGKNHEELLQALNMLRESLVEVKDKVSDLKYNGHAVDFGPLRFYADGLAVEQTE